jgi:hypothetical protein
MAGFPFVRSLAGLHAERTKAKRRGKRRENAVIASNMGTAMTYVKRVDLNHV